MRKPETRAESKSEIRADAWERFERAVDYAVKTPANHREVKKVTLKKRGTPKTKT